MKIKNFIFTALVCLFMAIPAWSQQHCPDGVTLQPGEAVLVKPNGTCQLLNSTKPTAHFLFGPNGGYNFGNTFIGGEVAVEVPLGNHFEIDTNAKFYPYEEHIALGHGLSYSVMPGFIAWVNHTSGVEGDYSHGGYTVTKATKAADYVYAGYVYRHTMFGYPTRFHFDYFRQVNNGISSNGTETNHVNGGAFTWDNLAGCFRSGCVRDSFTWYTGRTLNQGNPQCDGQYGGTITCPRQQEIGGGFEINVMFEFPRRKDENALF